MTTLLNRLVAKGMFPSQLPPCFTSESFGTYCEIKGDKIPGVPNLYRKNTAAENYSVARAGHFRRPTVIVNPHQYFFLAKEIASNWTELEPFLKESTLTVSSPDASVEGSRAITMTPTRALAEIKLLRSTGYKYALITDIAQFFPSIYTHSFSWALYGKKLVKQALGGVSGAAHPQLGNKLDEYTRHLQNNQTVGIPIGPDTSHILAEIIGVAMDKELIAKYGSVAGFRYVDDYIFFFNEVNEAERCLAAITQVLSSYELAINATKTRIVPVSQMFSDYWTHELKAFDISRRLRKQKRDLVHFFDIAFYIAERNADENVMKFALKKLSGNLIFPKNWPVVEANLLRALVAHPNTIIDVAHILYTYHFYKYQLDLAGIKRTLQRVILDHGPLGHHSEVAWALWIAGVLGISIDSPISDVVSQMGSSPCLILLLQLHKMGLCKTINNGAISERLTTAELYGDMWLAVYESINHAFLAPLEDPLTGTFFADLKSNGITFFNFTKRPKPLFKIRHHLDISSVFDEEEESYDEQDVEFVEIPDDYRDDYYEDEDEDESARDSRSSSSDLDDESPF